MVPVSKAVKRRLAGNTTREATSSEVSHLKQENRELKEMLAELALRIRVHKKIDVGMDGPADLL